MSTRSATPVLVVATVAVSLSAIFIRLAGDDAVTVVWLRMALAVALLAPWTVRRRRRETSSDSRVLPLVAVSGLLLAGHFVLWTASLTYTSVASSVLLVSMHPALVAPLSRRLLGDRVPRQMVLGIALALAGTTITCVGAAGRGSAPLLGDMLALGGAACLAGYLIIGRGLRTRVAVIPYSTSVFAVVSAVAASVALLSRSAHVPSTRTFLACLGLAVVCTIGGHVAYNWSLRSVPAATVSVAFLGEPPLTALLALVILGSAPSPATLGGGALILLGIGLTLLVPHTPPQEQPAVALE